MPTLKKRYGKTQRIRLAEIKLNHSLLLEQIDDKKLKEVVQNLEKIGIVLQDPVFAPLSEFQVGLKRANKHILQMTAQPIASWAKEQLPEMFTQLGKVSAFQMGITRVLKMMPNIAHLVKNSMKGIPDTGDDPKGWNPKENQQLHALLPEEDQERLRTTMRQALKMPGFLGWLGIRSIPFINRERAANELLQLTPQHIEKLATAVAALDTTPPPVNKETSSEVADIAQAGSPKLADREADQVIQTAPKDTTTKATKLPISSKDYEEVIRDAYFYAMNQHPDALSDKQAKTADTRIERLAYRIFQGLKKRNIRFS